MSSWAAQKIQDVDLRGKYAVVAGGTQGIGAGVALRFAQAGASVTIVGRSAERGQKTLDKLREIAANAASGAQMDFVQADLSRVAEMNSAAERIVDLAKARGGVNYLVETQGGPPSGKFNLTDDQPPLEKHFAVQCLSRFALPFHLARAGQLKDSFTVVAAPASASEPAPNVNDLDLQQAHKQNKFGILSCAKRDGVVLDGVVAELTERYPHLSAFHLFPGIVSSNAVNNNPDINVLLRWVGSIGVPVLARILGNSPESYASIPVYCATQGQAALSESASSQGRRYAFFNERLREMTPGKWLEDADKRKALWSRMSEMLGQKD